MPQHGPSFSFDSFCSGFTPARLDVLSRHTGTKYHVPVDEEWLREIALDTNDLNKRHFVTGLATEETEAYLMMNIMVIRVVGCNELQRIPWQPVPAVIIDSLNCREHKEHDCFTRS